LGDLGGQMMPSEVKLDLCEHGSPEGEGLGMRGRWGAETD
jgi:hypothetical protein